MKEELTNFICDQCQKEIQVMKAQRFPYDKGWCYIYNISGKRELDGSVAQRGASDKHFCCKTCMHKFIKNLFDVVYKDAKCQDVIDS